MTTPNSQRELLIEHTAEEGTTLTGTTRADGVYKALRSLGWLYRRSCNDFKLQYSEGRPFKRGQVKATANMLSDRLGVTVRVEADQELLPVAEVEADMAAAADVRAERLENRAERLNGLSEAAEKAAKAVFDAIPWGQPMLVDHHSYAADRNRRERAWKQVGRSYALGCEAAKVAAEAETAANRMKYRHSPVTVANRIDRLSAEQRKIERVIEQDNLAPHEVRGGACPSRLARAHR